MSDSLGVELQDISDQITSIMEHDLLRSIKRGLGLMLSERTTRIYLGFILFVLFLGIFGPALAPYEYNERVRGDDGSLLRLESPSLDHPLGTTLTGYDVLSRLLFGARPTVIAGLLGGGLIITIGLTIGLTAGYVGGLIDDILMRFTDLVYGVPLIVFALVLISIFGVGFLNAILIIGAILWRGSARVIRSQVMQIRELPYIQAAEAIGASKPYIIARHILPNIAPMAVLFFALGTGYTIVIMASLAFLGVTDPFIPSWGVMVRNAFRSGRMAGAPWWIVPPGMLISLTVLSMFMFGRGYERVASGEDDAQDDEAFMHAS